MLFIIIICSLYIQTQSVYTSLCYVPRSTKIAALTAPPPVFEQGDNVAFVSEGDIVIVQCEDYAGRHYLKAFRCEGDVLSADCNDDGVETTLQDLYVVFRDPHTPDESEEQCHHHGATGIMTPATAEHARQRVAKLMQFIGVHPIHVVGHPDHHGLVLTIDLDVYPDDSDIHIVHALINAPHLCKFDTITFSKEGFTDPQPTCAIQGQTWNTCASACTATCDQPSPPCTRQCVARCACPGKLVLHEERCIEQSECPESLVVLAFGTGHGHHDGLIDYSKQEEWGGYCNLPTSKHQSPIDVNEGRWEKSISGSFAMPAGASAVGMVFKGNVNTVNYGFTTDLRFNVPFLPGVTTTIANLHFHWSDFDLTGSEHALNGFRYAAETHMVTKKDTGGYVVIGRLFEVEEVATAASAPLDDLFNLQDLDSFNLAALYPSSISEVLVYPGSLTTPTCDETVTWVVIPEIATISRSQLDILRAYKNTPTNARDIQPTNPDLVVKKYKFKDAAQAA